MTFETARKDKGGKAFYEGFQSFETIVSI